jgi:hypothetical protein
MPPITSIRCGEALPPPVLPAEPPNQAYDSAGLVTGRAGPGYHEPIMQYCPICGTPLPYEPRYPGKLCAACVGRACDAQGRQIRFRNTTALGGGFLAEVEEQGDWQPQADPWCWVDGRRCQAGEHRFGGIVVQTVDDEPGSR